MSSSRKLNLLLINSVVLFGRLLSIKAKKAHRPKNPSSCFTLSESITLNKLLKITAAKMFLEKMQLAPMKRHYYIIKVGCYLYFILLLSLKQVF